MVEVKLWESFPPIYCFLKTVTVPSCPRLLLISAYQSIWPEFSLLHLSAVLGRYILRALLMKFYALENLLSQNYDLMKAISLSSIQSHKPSSSPQFQDCIYYLNNICIWTSIIKLQKVLLHYFIHILSQYAMILVLTNYLINQDRQFNYKSYFCSKCIITFFLKWSCFTPLTPVWTS